MNVTIIGATGLVGAQILKQSEASSAISAITTISRRSITETSKLTSVVVPSVEDWPENVTKTNSNIFFSAFGTTRAAAGGIENFKKIDYGTNLACAKAAKEANVDTFVLVSSAGASAGSFIAYSKIKGELEDEIAKLGFKRLIILRPGFLLGQREVKHTGFGGFLVPVAEFTRKTPFSIFKSVYADEVAKVAVSLATKPLSNDAPETTIVEANEIVKLAGELK